MCFQNTGSYNGVIACMEKALERPLHWIICMIHFLELPWKRFYEHVAGKTSGPRSLEGEIGEAISEEELTDKPIIDFKPIEGNVICLDPDEQDELDLSSDQLYFYEYVCAIQAWFYQPGVMA